MEVTRRTVLLGSAASVVAAAGGTTAALLGRSPARAVPVAEPVTVPSPSSAPPTPELLGPPRLRVATSRTRSLDVRTVPGGPQLVVLGPTVTGEVPVAAVVDSRPGWLQVMVPQRPNGTHGWVDAGAVDVTDNDHRLVVSIGARTVTHWDGNTSTAYPCAVGAPRTPTPQAVGYVLEKIDMVAAGYGLAAGYGPFLLGTSIHSEALQTFNGGDARIAVHGHGYPSTVGTAVSNGCCRMLDADVTRLWPLVPRGTPVHLEA